MAMPAISVRWAVYTVLQALAANLVTTASIYLVRTAYSAQIFNKAASDAILTPVSSVQDVLMVTILTVMSVPYVQDLLMAVAVANHLDCAFSAIMNTI